MNGWKETGEIISNNKGVVKNVLKKVDDGVALENKANLSLI